MRKKPLLALAGGRGFVGQYLSEALRDKYNLRILTRHPDPSDPEQTGCDLYSLRQTEEALKDVDYAFYLVHSMMPSAKMTQAHFSDLDLIVADNFARACAKNRVKQIIYLGGLQPPDMKPEEVSAHLASRFEVEESLSNYKNRLTVFRAGLVIGAGGSSFRILKALVKRLPVMVVPAWTDSKTQPVYIGDVTAALKKSIGSRKYMNHSFDLGCRDVMSYREMMQRTAAVMGRRLIIMKVPLNSYGLSKLWVRVFSGASMSLIAPLVESLKHDMTVSSESIECPTGFEESVRLSLHEPRRGRSMRRQNKEDYTVRSVQRLPSVEGRSVLWAARRYAIWLQKVMPRFAPLSVKFDRRLKKLRFSSLGIELLVLNLVKDHSDADRLLFYIESGVLVKNTEKPGRLEFRSVLGGRYILAAIHDFRPGLPWFIYRHTQANVHLMVMNAFKHYLEHYAVHTNKK